MSPLFWFAAVVLGAGVAPWVIAGPTLRREFARGADVGFAAWFGAAIVPTIIAVVLATAASAYFSN